MRVLAGALIVVLTAVAAWLWPRDNASVRGVHPAASAMWMRGEPGPVARDLQAPTPAMGRTQASLARGPVEHPQPRAVESASRPSPPGHARAALAARERVRSNTPIAAVVPATPSAPTRPARRAQAVAAAVAAAERDDPVAPIARLYLASFNRAPDADGLDYYAAERDGGTPLAEIADEFAGSEEFEARHGALDHAAFVELVSRNVLGRGCTPATCAPWIAQLDAGRLTRGEVMVALMQSPEFRAASGNEVFVTLAYLEALRRPPAQSEFSRWVALLDTGHPRAAVIDALLAGRKP